MSHILPEASIISIPTHGYEDSYNDFDNLYPEELRTLLATTALSAAQEASPNITEAGIWVSGFSGDYSVAGFESVDTAKLNRASAANTLGYTPKELGDENSGFEGDDSNEYNIIEREIYGLRQQKLALNQYLAGLYSNGLLLPSLKANAAAEMQKFNARIEDLKAVQENQSLPVYYATLLEGIRDDNPEDNPLAYIGNVPSTGYLALYNKQTMSADPALRISHKSDTQVRIAGRGLAVMRHALAVIQLDLVA